jgi:hypothetical protein
MGDVLSSIGSGVSDFFGGLGNDMAGLFGMGGGVDASGMNAMADPNLSVPPLDTVTAPAAPDVAATSPVGAGALGNPLPVTADPSTGMASMDPTFGAPPSVLPGGVGPSAPPALTPSASGPLNQVLSGKTGGGHGGSLLRDILGTGIIGLDIARASQTPGPIKAEEKLAAEQGALATAQNAIAEGAQQGILPTGGNELVQQNLDAEIAGIKNRYAQMNMSGSTAEQQDINAAKAAALAQRFQIGNELAKTSFSTAAHATGVDATLLDQIYQADQATQQQLADALMGIAGFGTDAGRTVSPA